MAMSASKMFRQTVADIWANTTALDLDAPDVIKAALYNNTTAPNQDDTAIHNAYNGTGGAWVVANEVIDTLNTNWVAGGRSIATYVFHGADTANTVWLDAPDTAGAGNVTITNAFGCLIYDDTLAAPVAKQGINWNYFGGAQGVTNGTFTIVWHVNGIWRLTL